jgi:hypothetical protein
MAQTIMSPEDWARLMELGSRVTWAEQQERDHPESVIAVRAWAAQVELPEEG